MAMRAFFFFQLNSVSTPVSALDLVIILNKTTLCVSVCVPSASLCGSLLLVA